MSKNWVMLTGLLFLGSMGASQAHSLDSPDTVYIDGLPCNSACQSYMAWSRRLTSSIAQRPAAAKAPPAKHVLRSPDSAAHRATALHRQASKPAAPRIAKQAVPSLPAKPQPADDAAIGSRPAPANVTASPPAGDGTATVKARAVQRQVAAATALAEQVTAESAVLVPRRDANSAGASLHPETVHPSDAEPAATSKPDNRVALLMARPEIKSVSDLSGRDVAIEDQQAASSASIRAAIASTGAAEVQLKTGPMKAVDRLIVGEVPAAVLTVVSPEAAEWFPDIPGYSLFRIPLPPGSLKPRS